MEAEAVEGMRIGGKLYLHEFQMIQSTYGVESVL